MVLAHVSSVDWLNYLFRTEALEREIWGSAIIEDPPATEAHHLEVMRIQRFEIRKLAESKKSLA